MLKYVQKTVPNLSLVSAWKVLEDDKFYVQWEYQERTPLLETGFKCSIRIILIGIVL